jgi:hypothetical protein
MNKQVRCLLLLCLFFILSGCNGEDAVKGKVDIQGSVTEVDREGNRILVDDEELGLVWVTLHKNLDITKYESGQEVVVWIKGAIKESSPAQAEARNIELKIPN